MLGKSRGRFYYSLFIEYGVLIQAGTCAHEQRTNVCRHAGTRPFQRNRHATVAQAIFPVGLPDKVLGVHTSFGAWDVSTNGGWRLARLFLPLPGGCGPFFGMILG